MDKLLAGALLAVGLIHLLPLVGALGPERLQALYGVALQEPNLVILMRHRAVLFGLLGAFLIVAAFVPGLRAAAIVAAFTSMISFIALAWAGGEYNAALRKVVVIDAVAIVALALVLGLRLLKPVQT